MILTNFRIEPRSDSPSAMQIALDSYAVAVNVAGLFASLALPYHWMMAANWFSRSLISGLGTKS